jgi:hypothetical protein
MKSLSEFECDPIYNLNQRINEITEQIYSLQSVLSTLESKIKCNGNFENLIVEDTSTLIGDVSIGVPGNTKNQGDLTLNGLVLSSSGSVLINPGDRTCAFTSVNGDKLDITPSTNKSIKTKDLFTPRVRELLNRKNLPDKIRNLLSKEDLEVSYSVNSTDADLSTTTIAETVTQSTIADTMSSSTMVTGTKTEDTTVTGEYNTTRTVEGDSTQTLTAASHTENTQIDGDKEETVEVTGTYTKMLDCDSQDITEQVSGTRTKQQEAGQKIVVESFGDTTKVKQFMTAREFKAYTDDLTKETTETYNKQTSITGDAAEILTIIDGKQTITESIDTSKTVTITCPNQTYGFTGATSYTASYSFPTDSFNQTYTLDSSVYKTQEVTINGTKYFIPVLI